ncbi:MAG: hypothetical protein AB1813_02345 [Verrucomicrobiota bacterium]|jgi:hypothetical protein
MTELAAKAELMRSLGRLVRGLSSLFWGLPLALIVFGLISIQTLTASFPLNALTEWIQSLKILPPVAVTGFLFYALMQLGSFQPQERVWQTALDRAKILALINFGLSPFLYWWSRMPMVTFYALAVALLLVSGLIFVAALNRMLDRLAAMLPDETLRHETKFFTSMNLHLLTSIVVLIVVFFVLIQFRTLPDFLTKILRILDFARQWLLLFLVLLPVAMTMTLIWKIKEVILASVFGPEH